MQAGPLSIPPPTTAGAAQVDTVDPSAAPVPEMPFYDRLDAYADFDSSARNLWLYVDEGGCVVVYCCLLVCVCL